MIMLTREQVITEIDGITTKNKEVTRELNTALNHARNALLAAEKDYTRGLEDAWNTARSLYLMSDNKRKKIFGFEDVKSIVMNNSLQDINVKVSAYEELQETMEVSIGSVVYDELEDCKATVLEIDYLDQSLTVFTQKGDVEIWYLPNAKCTGECVNMEAFTNI